MTTDLLIELGCEDLPARYVVPLAGALTTGITDGLRKRGIVYQQHIETFATPRRIGVIVSAVATQQPEQKIERFGPAVAAAFKDNEPTPAALGFAKSCGVEFSAIGQKDCKLHYAKTAAGKSTVELIPEIFEETLKQMDELVPKRMRWGSGTETFVRPVQWIVALLGTDVIPLKRFDLTAGRTTYGHRFHAPAAIELKSPADYADKLKAAKVWADVASRKANIKQQIEAEAKKLGGTARITEDLLDEVTALVEWPVVISGRMEERFMQLPAEAIIATVETNQRYFTVFAGEKLLPVFITISNIESKDVSQVIAGNERVVRPRLTDALFFWEQDLKQGFVTYVHKLETVTYQKELGSIAKKVQRIDDLAIRIMSDLQVASISFVSPVVRTATSLCKNDLVTKMVYEMPELQGVMGGYYAKKSGESAAVATAIREHYLPTQQGTPIPSTREGQIVALADKLDTLAGIFAIGQKPTASKDPFALRRAALSALRICIEGDLPLDISALLKIALEAQPAGKRDEVALKELTEFVFERLRAYYDALPVEMFEAVKALGIASALDFDSRVRALNDFWGLPNAKLLAAAHKRTRNILPTALDLQDIESFDRLLLSGSDADKALYRAIESTKDRFSIIGGVSASAEIAVEWANKSFYERYREKLFCLAALQPDVYAFFEQPAKVMDPDPIMRRSRITLLRHLNELCREVADISLLPG